MASTVVDAHPKTYLGVNSDFFVGPAACDDDLPVNVNGVCYSGGHVVPDAEGRATFTITDSVSHPTGAVFLQATSAIGFCGSITVVAGLSWDPTEDVLIWLDGPVFGNPILGVCGGQSAGTTGTVDHS